MGFRPFVFRLAHSLNLKGLVDNRTNCVRISIEGHAQKLSEFLKLLVFSAPPASQIKSVEINSCKPIGYKDFRIAPSTDGGQFVTEISPDIAVCSDCLADLQNDPARIDYPLVNCTNCGPRFTIITDLPYDRHNTSMRDFGMCEKCEKEYNNVFDRRFHAQPVACNHCGPNYVYEENGRRITKIGEILSAVARRINEGGAVAVKGQGGYHLICDALNTRAVESLRMKKHRDAKPFAVMFSNIETLLQYCFADNSELEELTSWRRPIVILRQKSDLPRAVNSGLGTVGAILPYMPLHYMLFRCLETPAIVFTSGNLSEEPVIKDDDKARKLLLPITGALLLYNREIVNRADDSVVKFIAGKPRLIRRSRGYVPAPVDLEFNVEGIFALGAEQKNCFCIGRENQAIMSQHIGDLKNLSAYEFLREAVDRFCRMFRFKPEIIASDMHPDYLSTVYAEMLHQQLGIPLIKVQHHHAHIASCLAENHINDKVIGVAFDGTGFGTDEKIWGGEFFIASLLEFERYTHFDYIPLPGGDKVIDEPWRTAFSYIYRYFGEKFDYSSIKGLKNIGVDQLLVVREMISREINSPLSSAAGRLFDAVSALIGLCSVSSFESEAPIRLEAVISEPEDGYYPFEVADTVSFRETIKSIIEESATGKMSYISAKFHNTIAMSSLKVSEKIRNERSINKVVLSGGVFQNKYLLEKTMRLLAGAGFEVYANKAVPANDGGIALGQLAVASKKREICV